MVLGALALSTPAHVHPSININLSNSNTVTMALIAQVQALVSSSYSLHSPFPLDRSVCVLIIFIGPDGIYVLQNIFRRNRMQYS